MQQKDELGRTMCPPIVLSDLLEPSQNYLGADDDSRPLAADTKVKDLKAIPESVWLRLKQRYGVEDGLESGICRKKNPKATSWVTALDERYQLHTEITKIIIQVPLSAGDTVDKMIAFN